MMHLGEFESDLTTAGFTLADKYLHALTERAGNFHSKVKEEAANNACQLSLIR